MALLQFGHILTIGIVAACAVLLDYNVGGASGTNIGVPLHYLHDDNILMYFPLVLVPSRGSRVPLRLTRVEIGVRLGDKGG